MSVTPITQARSRRSTRPWADTLATQEIGPVEEFLPRFVVHLDAAGRSAKTIDRYERATRQFGVWLNGRDLAGLGRTDMESYIVMRRQATSGSTAATDFVSLQQFFKFVKLDLGRIRPDYASPMDGMACPRFEPPRIEIVPEEFLAALIRHAEGPQPVVNGQNRTFEGLRDAALLRIFTDTGCRLSEVTTLSLSQIVDAPLLIVVGKSKGRGPVPRQVEIGEKAERALRRYLRARAQHPDAGRGELWLGQRGPLTPNGVRQMIKRRSRALGMHVNPHRFRHTAADSFLSNGGSEGDLMALMGWRSDTMPRRYGASRAAARALENQRKMGFRGDAL